MTPMFLKDSTMFRFSTAEFQALQLIALVVFGAVD